MSLRIKLLIFIIALPIFIYLYSLNPSAIQFYFVRERGISVPILLLISVSFIIGMLFAIGLIVLSDVKGVMNDWKERRLVKRSLYAQRLYLDGVLNMCKGNLIRARAILMESLKSDPHYIDAYIKIGETYILDNRLDEAEDILKKGLSINPLNAEISLKLADCYLKADKRETAYEFLGGELKEEPDNLCAKKRLRDMFVEDRRWQDALRVCEDITEHTLDKDFLNGIRYEAAKDFYDKGLFDCCMEQIDKILSKDMGFIPAYILKGHVFYKKGNISSAVRLWERAFRRCQHIALFLQIEDMYLKESVPHRIIKLYKRTLDFHPDNNILRQFLARLYLKLEMIDEAIGELKIIMAEEDGTRYQNLLLADALARRGRFQESAQAYKNAAQEGKCAPAFRCRNCGSDFNEWTANCPSCKMWNTIDATCQ